MNSPPEWIDSVSFDVDLAGAVPEMVVNAYDADSTYAIQVTGPLSAPQGDRGRLPRTLIASDPGDGLASIPSKTATVRGPPLPRAAARAVRCASEQRRDLRTPVRLVHSVAPRRREAIPSTCFGPLTTD